MISPSVTDGNGARGTKGRQNVQGLGSAPKESRKRSHRTVIEVDADTIFVSCGISDRGGSWSARARAQRDDMGRALWPLDARHYKALALIRWGRGVGTCAMFAAGGAPVGRCVRGGAGKGK